MSSLQQKLGFAALLVAASCLADQSAVAQHSDVEFEYHDGMIEVEFGHEGRVFESDFPTSGAFEQNTDDPGFAAGEEDHDDEDGGHGSGDVHDHEPLEPDDIIDYNILGPLEYHDGNGFAPVPAGVGIQIDDNPTGGLLVTSATTGPVSGAGAIGQADEHGDLHGHIEFTLTPGEFDELNNPPVGAYALLMSLSSYQADGVTPTGIADSLPFYIVFNFGLEEDENLPGPHFHDAVEAFAAKIPEPTSFALFGIAAAGIGLVRRRRKA